LIYSIFKKDTNFVDNKDGRYEVNLYRISVFPFYNITTSSYINSGEYGSIFDNDVMTGVDFEGSRFNPKNGLPYRIVLFMPISKTFRGKLKMDLVTPWTRCLPRRMRLFTMNRMTGVYGPGNSEPLYNPPNIQFEYNQYVDLGQVGDDNQVNQNRIRQQWGLNLTSPFNTIIFEIISQWGSTGRDYEGGDSVWITSINFEVADD